MSQVSVSILGANQANLEEAISKIKNANADYVHFDVMDGVFVNNISFGLPVLKDLKAICDTVPFDVHLMIVNPKKYISDFVNAGADLISFHYEACKSKTEIFEIIDQIHLYKKKAGLAINPDTPIEAVYTFLGSLDYVLVMSVYPGFAGQKFNQNALRKIFQLKEYIKANQYKVLIEVDGGVNKETYRLVKAMGTDILVSAKYLFEDDDFNIKVVEMQK